LVPQNGHSAWEQSLSMAHGIRPIGKRNAQHLRSQPALASKLSELRKELGRYQVTHKLSRTDWPKTRQRLRRR